MRIQAFTQGKTKKTTFRPVSSHRFVFGIVIFGMISVCAWTWVSPFGVSAGQNNPGDPNRGREVFEKRCAGCHALDREKHGPRLRGVFGRKSGSIASFKYSDALKSANVIWDAASFDQWLTGKLPLTADTPASLIGKVLTEVPIAPRASVAEVSPLLSAAIMQALEKDREKRPRTALEFLAILDRA